MSFELIGLAVPAMFTLIGGVFAVAGVRGVVEWYSFSRRAVRCTGTVTEIRARVERGTGSDSSSTTIYYPVLAFRTPMAERSRPRRRTGRRPP